jgi:hypothetical protein
MLRKQNGDQHVTTQRGSINIEGLGLFCLTPLSTILWLYRGSQFYWWKRPECPDVTNDLSQIIDKLYQVIYCIDYASPWAGFELTISVLIVTDWICSCTSNYHAITTTTALKISLLFLNDYMKTTVISISVLFLVYLETGKILNWWGRIQMFYAK